MGPSAPLSMHSVRLAWLRHGTGPLNDRHAQGGPGLDESIHRALSNAAGIALESAVDGQAIDWCALAHRIAAIDAGLNHLGYGPGSTVAVPGRNDLACAVAVLALVSSRRCAAIFNPFQPPKPRLAAAQAYRPDAILLPEGDEAIDSDTAESPVLVMTEAGDVREHRSGVGGLEAGPRRAGIVISTSGTTGDPKPFALSLPVLSRALGEIAWFNAGFGDRRHPGGAWPPLIQYSPLAHIAGALTLLRAAGQGRGTVLLGKFDSELWAQKIEAVRPFTTGLPPTMLRMVLDANIPAERLTSLVSIWSGSAPVNVGDPDAFTARYGLPVLGNYGATEFCGAVAVWSLDDYLQFYPARRGAVGRLDPRVAEVRVRDVDGAIMKEPGPIGSLEIRVNRMGNHWIASSDIGCLDSDGFLTLHGRSDEVIVRGGFKLSPGKIADTLREHPAVREVGVIGLPDARLGQVPVAAVETIGDIELDVAELLAFAKARLPAYFLPVRVVTVPSLPRTVAMKLDRRAIGKLFER